LAQIPEIELPAGTYFIGMRPVGTGTISYIGATSTITGSECYFQSNIFGYPSFVPGSVEFGVQYDAGFCLFFVGGGACVYTPGDINNNGDVNGVDVGYGVNYFKGFGPPPPIDCGTPVGPCPEASPFYAAGDVNANFTFNGVDITYFVNYLKGIGPPLSFAPDCPPAAAAAPGQIIPAVQPSKAKIDASDR
jgi:hypothetical protein